MFDLSSFTLSDMLAVSDGLRDAARGAGSMEQAAGAVVDYFRTSLIDKNTGEPSCALVRIYKTHPFGRLEEGLREYVRQGTDAEALDPDSSCLTLLATSGLEPDWNDRRASEEHRAIWLGDAVAIQRLPMVARLVEDLGFSSEEVVRVDPQLFILNHRRDFGVFYVPEARGSNVIPAQEDFVLKYGIRSVLGFGGLLPDGSIFAAVLFSSQAIPKETADLIASVALGIKLVLLPFVFTTVFDGEPALSRAPGPEEMTLQLQAQVSSLNELLEVRGGVVSQQALRLEQAWQAAEARATELTKSQEALKASEQRTAAIVEAALDCIISMDAAGRIVEFNHAAETTFGYSREEAVGTELADLIIPPRLRDAHRRGLESYLVSGQGPVIGARVEVDALRRDGSEFPVELTVTRVEVPGPALFTGFVRDITARREAEVQLNLSRDRLARIASTLQRSLLPPELPDISWLEVAAAYKPAGEGIEVGGDFYDLFETGRDDWGMVLGDVVGKGPKAAALTGLARYTLRAAAMRSRRPSSILSVLNEAIVRQFPDEFCTVAYCRLRKRDGVVTLTASVGGHPPPLVVSSTGDVRAMADPGLIVGAFEGWHGKDRRTRLSPGDTLIIYSDGVTEARREDDLFGEERLLTWLKQTARASVEEVAQGLAAAAEEHHLGSASDDIAILVARVR
ncbi:MAG: PP2C family protein-serine/threonine phosphatase [Actinomycetota bacterium]